jgi:hypothetical protein
VLLVVLSTLAFLALSTIVLAHYTLGRRSLGDWCVESLIEVLLMSATHRVSLLLLLLLLHGLGEPPKV